MKKIALLFLCLFAGVTSLFAGEAAVKQTIINELKLCAAGDIKATLKYYTKDFVVTDLDDGEKLSYREIELMATAMDGKHPEEFVLVAFQIQSGKKPTPEQEKQLRAMAHSAQVKAEYPKLCKDFIAYTKKSSKIELKTLKFVKVDVKGNQATVVGEYETLDSEDRTMTKRIKKVATRKLRKVNGVWMFCEQTVKKIK